MRALSASDSVSVAVQRTRDFLFRPFTWGTYLKLGLVAIITEGWGTNLRSAKGGHPPSGRGPMIYSPFDMPAGPDAAVVAGMLFLFFFLRFLFFSDTPPALVSIFLLF